MSRTRYTLGPSREFDIRLRGRLALDFRAEIRYDRGDWILDNVKNARGLAVNGVPVTGPTRLSKRDRITVGTATVLWRDYLYEGDAQDLYLEDLTALTGRISRANFRTLSVFATGLAVCVYFSPSVLAFGARGGRGFGPFGKIELMSAAAPYMHGVGFAVLALALLWLATKRIRDTGKPWWVLFVPGYNLYALYVTPSRE